MRLLLDTHALIWAVADPARLPSRLQTEIANPAVDVLVSPVSAWEVAIKVSLGRLEFQLVDAALLERFRFRLHPVALRHTTEVAHLPHHHGDPFDRMLVAQARIDALIMATDNSDFNNYDVEVRWD